MAKDWYPSFGSDVPASVQQALRVMLDNQYALRDHSVSNISKLKTATAKIAKGQSLQAQLSSIPGMDFLVNGSSGSVFSQQGSIVPLIAGGFTYDNTIAGQIIWAWSGLKALPPHLVYAPQNFISIADGTKAITGLTAGHTANFYPYYDLKRSVLDWAAPEGTGAVGSPAIAYDNVKNMTAAQFQQADGHLNLSSGAMSASVTAGGGGGGGGGGSGCLMLSMKVLSRDSGVKELGGVKIGEMIRGRRDWTRVTGFSTKKISTAILADFSATQWSEMVIGSPNHPMSLADDALLVRELCDSRLSDLFVGKTGEEEHAIRLRRILAMEGPFEVGIISCEPDHEFWTGLTMPCISTHNIDPK